MNDESLSAREQFISTTCELLELQGYHATGLNQITKESGSPKGSLYYYFPGGKEELTAEAVQHVGEMVAGRIRTALATEADPAQAVRRFFLQVAQGVESSGYRTGGPITIVAIETAATSERLRELCHTIYGSWQAAFQARLEAGGIAPVKAEMLACHIVASLEGCIILCRTGRTPEPLRQVAELVYVLINQSR
jgi:TetR/AcrR family transcriptional regulator, lmrAB and yxaGH operons repressor